MDTKDALKKTIVVAGIGLGAYILLLVTDVLIFWWLYTSSYKAFLTYGGVEYGNKLLAVLFASLASFANDTFFRRLLRRDSRWVIALGGAMAVWFALMFLVTLPYSGAIFDGRTGEVQAKYLRLPDGTLKKFPLGLNFDPETGQPLLTFDKKTAEEYNKQERRQAAQVVVPSKPASPPASAAVRTAPAVTPPPAAAVVQKVGMLPTFHPFGADGCYEQDLGYEARWSPKDKAMRVYDPGGGSHVEALGGKPAPLSAFGPGRWKFCREDPDATGVVIWE